MNRVVIEVTEEFGSTPCNVLKSTRGSAEDAWVRAIAVRVYRDLAPDDQKTLTALGELFGRDRTTVRHALSRVQPWTQTLGFSTRMAEVKQRVQERR